MNKAPKKRNLVPPNWIQGIIATVIFFLVNTTVQVQPVDAREQFGKIQVNRGTLTIIRSGNAVNLESNQEAGVQKFDLLMGGRDTNLNWQLEANSSIQLGNNSMVMIRPWKRFGETGYITLGYGAAKLQSGNTRILKTPAAIIRYTGLSIIEVTSTGNTLVSVLNGDVEINNLSATTATLSEGQAALVVNGDLILPEKEQLAGLNISDPGLQRPPLNSPLATAFKAEAAILGAGLLPAQLVEQSRNTEVTANESFDEQVKGAAEIESGRPAAKPVNSEMAADLEALGNMETIEVQSETDELGTIQIRENRPENVFAEFDEPKNPGMLFDLNDKTSWTLESGLILVTIEK